MNLKTRIFWVACMLLPIGVAIAQQTPVIVVTPQTLTVNLDVADPSPQVRDITITNQGSANLEFYVTVRRKDPFMKGSSLSRIAMREAIPSRKASLHPRPDRKNTSRAHRSRTQRTQQLPYSAQGSQLFGYTSEGAKGKIAELNPMDGSWLRSFEADPAIGFSGLAYDGQYLYAVDAIVRNTISKIDAVTGEKIDTFFDPDFPELYGLAHDGEYLYAITYIEDSIYQIDFSAKQLIKKIPLDFYTGDGLTHGGNRETLFATDFTGATIYEVNETTGETINTLEFADTCYFSGIAYSAAANVLFAYDANSVVLYALDPNTGAILNEIYPDFDYSGLAADEAYQPIIIDHATIVVTPGEQITVPVQFSSKGLLGKTYHYEILVNSNDPAQPEVMIPVTLNVAGPPPEFSRDNTQFNFGTVYVTQSKTIRLKVSNQSTGGVLNISNITTTDDRFTVNATNMMLNPATERFVEVTFTPGANGNVTGTLHFETNDPDHALVELPLNGTGLLPPVIQADKTMISVEAHAGETANATLTISNTGNSSLNWNSWLDIDDDELEPLLKRLNTGYERITSRIPSRYDFAGGDIGVGIDDDLEPDMYDFGNRIYAWDPPNLKTMWYTNGVIKEEEILGGNSLVDGKYFTTKHPGLFTFVAHTDLNEFEITGELSGKHTTIEGTALTLTTVRGIVFKGFVKRAYGPDVPSVNHIFMIQSRGPANHSFSTSVYSDEHTAIQSGFDLGSIHRVYYLMFSSQPGVRVDDVAMTGIMSAFLNTIAYPEWVNIVPEGSGQTGVQESDVFQLKFNTTGLMPGLYETTLYIRSNDPKTPEMQIPISFNVLEASGNHTPQVVKPIPDASTLINEAITINLNEHFIDPDGDALTYSALSSDLTVAETVMNEDQLTITRRKEGNITITVTATDPSAASTMAVFDLGWRNISGVEEDPDRHYSFSPNPFSEIVTCSITWPEKAYMRLTLQDSFGRTVAVPIDGLYEPGEMVQTINLADRDAGIYYYSLAINKTVFTGKLLKIGDQQK